MPNINELPAHPKSRFVTAIAWAFIAFSVFLTFNLSKFITHHESNVYVRIIPALIFIVVILVSAIGMFKRKNWSRRILIGVTYLLFIYVMAKDAQLFRKYMEPQNIENIISFLIVLEVLIIGILIGWVGQKLRSKKIAAEFH